MKRILKTLKGQSEFSSCDVNKPHHIPAKDIAYGHQTWNPIAYHPQSPLHGHFAIRVCVQLLYQIILTDTPLWRDFNAGLMRREVAYRLDAYLPGLARLLYGLNEGLGRRACRNLPDDNLPVAILLYFRTQLYRAVAVIVSRRIHDSTLNEIRVQLERPVLEDGNLGINQLVEVVRKHHCRHSDGNALRTHHQQNRKLCRKHDRLPVPAIV